MNNETKIVGGRRTGKSWEAWLMLLKKLKAEPRKTLTMYCTTREVAKAARDKWYRFKKMVEGNPELYELYKDVLESRVARIVGAALVLEYKEPLGIEAAIRTAVKS